MASPSRAFGLHHRVKPGPLLGVAAFALFPLAGDAFLLALMPLQLAGDQQCIVQEIEWLRDISAAPAGIRRAEHNRHARKRRCAGRWRSR